MGGPVDCRCNPATVAASRPEGEAFILRWPILPSEAGRSGPPVRAGWGGLRMRILQECHDSPLGGHLSRRKTAALVRRLAYWPGDVAAYIRSCEVCQCTKARA